MDSAGSGQGHIEGCCEPSRTMKGREFLDQLSDCQCVKTENFTVFLLTPCSAMCSNFSGTGVVRAVYTHICRRTIIVILQKFYNALRTEVMLTCNVVRKGIFLSLEL